MFEEIESFKSIDLFLETSNLIDSYLEYWNNKESPDLSSLINIYDSRN